MIAETRTKILPVKTGNDFLVSSHFQIGKEPQWLSRLDPLAYKSTFQKDYPPRKIERVGLANIPQPAFIMHKDDRTKHPCSITREQFTPADYSSDNTYSPKSLTKTNFKMDRDDRIDTFITTDDYYYRPIPPDLQPKHSKIPWEPMKSHIPQGDREKVECPESDYKRNFHKKPLTCRDEVTNDTFVGPKTIKGDIRSHGYSDMFNTTSRKDFPAHHGYRKAVVPEHVQYPKTRIPCGENIRQESTHQVSFKGKFPSISALFDRNHALSELQKTTFINGDNRLDCFRTTADECYSYIPRRDNLPIAKLDMGKSSFPEGDRDPIRSAQRIRVTVNRSDYKPPPKDYHNHIVDGSNLHTISNVSFGNDKRAYYETTTESNFPFKSSRYEKIGTETTHSSVPLNHYGNLASDSSYRIDYRPTNGVKKLVPNPLALKNLRQSHIGDPIKGLREFSTTHSDTYTRKETSHPVNIDTGRLQKSSIPIGTMCY